MKKLIRQIAALTLIALAFAVFDIGVYNLVTTRYIDRRSAAMQAKSIELDRYLPFADDTEIVQTDAGITLTGDLPVLDGAAALYPVFSAFVHAMYPPESVEFDGTSFTQESKLHFTNTRGAYKAVVDGDADLIFCAKPSAEQQAYAAENGCALALVPIGHEAFVFLVHSDNPVESLTVDQVRGIYAGDYTRWSEVGGENRRIDALQRNAGSGSQTAMLGFMGDIPMKKRPVLGDGSAIGFSFRYYVESLAPNSGVKMLALNGVYPDKAHIADGSYPIVGDLYAVYDKSNPNENIPRMLGWILSEEGQSVVEQSGYVPLQTE